MPWKHCVWNPDLLGTLYCMFVCFSVQCAAPPGWGRCWLEQACGFGREAAFAQLAIRALSSVSLWRSSIVLNQSQAPELIGWGLL